VEFISVTAKQLTSLSTIPLRVIIIINSCIQALFGPRFGSMRANLGTIG
jgi:hypothetical protein